MDKTNNIIETKDITMEFPGVKALSDINISVVKGEIHAIVGENGAGKSTLMKILSGVYVPTSGQLLINAEVANILNPQDASEKYGIGIIHQEFSLVPYLNAAENIFLGQEVLKGKFLDKKFMIEKSKELLAALKVELDVTVPVNKLSVAQQQFVEIAKATATKTDILIFDEPTACLTGNEVENLFNLIFHLRDQGVTILYISHHLEEIYTLSDRFSVLRDGKYIGTRETASTSQTEMVSMMVGRDVIAEFPPRVSPISDEVILKVNNITNSDVTDIKFDLHKGEIIGFAGLVGAGRSEIIRALIGADESDVYDVEIDGEKASIKSPEDALKYGFGLIPEDRKRQGLVLGMSVKENSTISVIKELTNKLKLINNKNEKIMVMKSIKDLQIKTPTMNQYAKNLSGGNQQKIVLAKWMNTDSRILIFDEPTRGIDIGAKDEIYKLIRELSEQGKSIIMVSSELIEVLGLSDRVYSVYNGKIAAEVTGSGITAENVMYYCTGGI